MLYRQRVSARDLSLAFDNFSGTLHFGTDISETLQIHYRTSNVPRIFEHYFVVRTIDMLSINQPLNHLFHAMATHRMQSTIYIRTCR